MEKFQFDVISQTLTITAQFAKMMNDPESDEYKLVMRFRQDFPNLTITKKTHKSATHCTTKSGEKFNCNQFVWRSSSPPFPRVKAICGNTPL